MLALAQNSPSSSGITIMPIAAVVGVVTFIIMMIFVALAAGRARRRAIAERIQSLKLIGAVDPSEPDQIAAYQRVFVLHNYMRNGHRGVEWFAQSAPAPGVPAVFMIEHTYRVSSGKNSHNVYHTVACVDVPETWGGLTVARESVFVKIGKLFGMKDLDLEDPAFNKAWRVSAGDENFALAVLSPDVQRLLAAPAPFQNETWIVTRGCLALLLGRQIKPEEIEPLRTRLLAFISALAPELRDQIAPQSEPGR